MTVTAEVSCALPQRWQRRTDPERGVVIAARPKLVAAGGGAGPEIVVRQTVVDTDDLATWRAGAIDAMAKQLDDFALEDSDEFHLGERRVAYRRFAHRIGMTDVLCDQWAWLVDTCGYTLTCSVPREDYVLYCDLFEHIAASIEFHSAPEPAPEAESA